MKRALQMTLGVVAVGVAIFGFAGESRAANPNNWGPLFVNQSTPETASNVNGDTVTIQATVFSNSSWATVSSNTGSYINSQELHCTTGNQGADELNNNIIFICTTSGTALSADALVASGRTGLESL